MTFNRLYFVIPMVGASVAHGDTIEVVHDYGFLAGDVNLDQNGQYVIFPPDT